MLCVDLSVQFLRPGLCQYLRPILNIFLKSSFDVSAIYSGDDCLESWMIYNFFFSPSQYI
jgi:hypothetical protein